MLNFDKGDKNEKNILYDDGIDVMYYNDDSTGKCRY